MEMSDLKDRFQQISDYKDISIRKLEEFFSLNRGNISNISVNGAIGSDKLAKIIDKIPEISIEWLLTGKGEMLKSPKESQQVPASPNKDEQNKVLPAKNAEYGDKRAIPLIPAYAMAGAFTGDIQVLEYECEQFIIPTFKEADFLISVKGSSMTPKYNSGDLVACKKMPIDTFFQWNKVYVLDTEQGPLIKRIMKGSSNVNLSIHSDNPDYPPFELHRSSVHNIALVVGVIRLE